MYTDKPSPIIIAAMLNYDLEHYGVKRRSGRYPWGSGDNPYQRSGDFLARYESLSKQGMTEKQIAENMGIDSVTHLRIQKQVAIHERRELEVDRIKSLREDGLSLREIAAKMGYENESSVRSKLNAKSEVHMNRAKNTAEILKKELKEKGMLDVGAGVERELGISQSNLSEALYRLQLEGYNVYGVGIPQVTNPGQQTNTKILTTPDVSYGDVYKNMGDVKSVKEYHSDDGGTTYRKLQYPASLDSSRVGIRYGDEGGLSKDGVMEIRRGVPDLDLGNSHYAQVRILVDGTHYLKGMAMYSDDLPDGIDIMFNTNKKSGTDKMDVLKPIKTDDPDNPFGAAIKANGQSAYTGKDGKQHLSPINKLKEEGDWDTMSRNLSAQFLGKQPMQLIKRQLDLTYKDYEDQYSDIMALTNPTIKRKLLMDFANGMDSAREHLKAAALPRQSTQVILPLDCMKDTEIYAPNYKHGEQVALIRYPHGGTFEIPILTVNNKNPKAKSILGNAIDAVGINSKVAERLSGADFDGDQVVVIPTHSSKSVNGTADTAGYKSLDKVKIISTRPLEGLIGFDPKDQYPYKDGMKVMTKKDKQKQMGMVSNLITDMTLRMAPEDDIAAAVRHSMVVIDAEKHKLNYKQSEKDNHIDELKKKYQVRYTEDGQVKEGGASTLISRKKQNVRVPERKGSPQIDKETGEVSYKESGRTYVDKNGKTVRAETEVSLMSVTKDAHTLSSGTPQEEAYADYANKLGALANRARKEAVNMPRLEYKPEARKKYAEEVSSLNSKLNVAAKNAPRERMAQIYAGSKVKAIKEANPDMDKGDLKKLRQRAMNEARNNVGAKGKDTRIDITDKEWEAIQAGAITDTNLTQILRYANDDKVRELATPRTTKELSTAKQNKIKAMMRSGYSNKEISDALGVSTSTVFKYIKEK